MLTLEEKSIAWFAIVVVLIGCGLAYNWHERNIGAAKCEQADTKALKDQLAKQAIQLAAYQKQLGDADAQHKTDLKAIADAASKPAPRILCHAASSSPLSSLPAPSSGVPAATGNTDAVRTADYDPLPALTDLSAAYERRVETARDALNKWPGAAPL